MTFLSRLLEMDLHTLEDAEQDSLLDLLRAGRSLLSQQRKTKPIREPIKETVILMAVTQTTDDQVFTQVFSLADADMVPVGTDSSDGSSSPVTVAVVDPAGADISKWVEVTPDGSNPLKFVYSRKPDTDGTQPQDLAFIAIGTATVAGAPAEFRQDLMFTPGTATSLTATITSGPASPLAPEAPAGS